MIKSLPERKSRSSVAGAWWRAVLADTKARPRSADEVAKA